MSSPSRFLSAIVARIKQESFRGTLRRTANFWSILEYGGDDRDGGRYETRYSRMLRWLLDPTETHSLGGYFADGLLRLAAGGTADLDPDDELAPIDLERTTVLAERDRIDVLLEDSHNRQVLVIENKMHAAEGFSNGISQLQTYFERTQERYGKDHTIEYLYLTLEGKEPDSRITRSGANDEEPEWLRPWKALSYSALVPLLEGAILRTVWSGNRDAQKVIEDFMFDAQAQGQRYSSDAGSNSLVNEFYAGAKEALDNNDYAAAMIGEIIFAALGSGVTTLKDARDRLGTRGAMLEDADNTLLDQAQTVWVSLRESFQKELPAALSEFSGQGTLRQVVQKIWELCPDFDKGTRSLNADMGGAIRTLREENGFGEPMLDFATDVVKHFSGPLDCGLPVKLAQQQSKNEWSLALLTPELSRKSFRIATFTFQNVKNGKGKGERVRVNLGTIVNLGTYADHVKEPAFAGLDQIEDAVALAPTYKFCRHLVLGAAPSATERAVLFQAIESIAKLTAQHAEGR